MNGPVTRPRLIKTLLADRGLRPNRGLGQNFLVDDAIRDEVLRAAGAVAGEHVLEIGPGLGALTEALLAAGVRVTAVEKDRGLAAILAKRLGDSPGFSLTCQDALDFEASDWFRNDIRSVISNLPYASGTRILVELLEADPGPSRMALTLQLDVARRLTSPTGTRDYGLLTVLGQQDFAVEIRRVLHPGSFWPQPKVRSALLLLARRAEPLVPLRDRALFKVLVRHAFSQRRKQMQTIVRRTPGIPGWPDESIWQEIFHAAGVDPVWRPERISPERWARLANAFAERRGEPPGGG